MGINIKNPEVEALAKRVASATGETMTTAIKLALEEKLERIHRKSDYVERKARIREIVKSFGPVPEGFTSDHSDLYDELGLPK